jgi:hypothetical protein
MSMADNFIQFQQLLQETDITVGVARRIFEKRYDLKSRAFTDLKKEAEKKCIESVRILFGIGTMRFSEVSVSGRATSCTKTLTVAAACGRFVPCTASAADTHHRHIHPS